MLLRSLTVRAAIAVAFLVGFYVAAGCLGLGLLGGAFAIVAYGGRIPVKLVALMALAGGTVLWSLIPRRAKFEPPGPEITAREHPQLFAVIEEIAGRMGQMMPRHVYVMPDVNAFVAQVGGFLGIGTRRVMAIGLGLLAADNVSQLRATIAHEFGHYAGGDTKLGGLVYATRSAMIRSIQNLGGSLLQGPFVWAFKTYMRLTNAISRHQELIADEWSVRIAGKTAHVTGLRAEAVHGAAFGLFLRQEVAPLVGRGVGPDNVFAGYRAYAKSSTFTELEPAVAKVLSEREHDPYDSHPALEERIAYAEKLDLPDLPMDEAPASSLLGTAGGIEERLSKHMLPEGLRFVTWAEASEHFGRNLIDAGQRLQARSSELDLGKLLDILGDAGALRKLVEKTSPMFVGANYPDLEKDLHREAGHLVGGYVASLLVDRGWKWQTMPGEELTLEREGVRFGPVKACIDLLTAKAGVAGFEATLAGMGLDRLSRVTVSDEAAKSATERRARVRIEDKGAKTLVHVGFRKMMWPRCCLICCGSADERVELELPIDDKTRAEIAVHACREHQPRLTKAIRIAGYVAATDLMTFELENARYAELIDAVNA